MEGSRSSAIQQRLPPNNLEAERSVLGAVFLDPGAMDQILLLLAPEDFFHHPHRLTYECMLELYQESMAIDQVSVGNRLQQKDALEQVGGAAFLVDLTSGVLTSANVEVHARIVQEKAIYRRLIRAAEKITDGCFTEESPAQELVESAERAVVNVLDSRVGESLLPLSEVIDGTVEEIERRSQNPGDTIGVSSGLADLDRLLGGLNPSDLLILAARPSVGKTSLGLNIVRSVGMVSPDARQPGLRAAVFSMEMSREQITQRLLSLETAVPSTRLRSGRDLSPSDWSNILEARNRLAASRIFIDDTPGLGVVDLLARCRRLHRREPIDLIMVDYLQLMTGGRGRSENRQQEVSEISRGLKALAKELSVPVLALSQLSRAVEKRTDRRPQLADLRESGAIEQDADVVMFIHRPDPLKEGAIEFRGQSFPSQTHAELIVAKQRNGPTGSVLLYFEPELMKFSLCDLDHQAAVPPRPAGMEDFSY